MAIQKVYSEEAVSNIASAIREVTGETNTYKISEMDEAILDIYGSPKAFEISVKTCDLATQLEHPEEPILDSDYTPEVFQKIKDLIYKIEGGQ